jgi:hypothetical protein
LGHEHADQWLENHPEAPAVQCRTLKQQIRDAWKQRSTLQGREMAQQALAGLAEG